MASGRQPAAMPDLEANDDLAGPTSDQAMRPRPRSKRAWPREVRPAGVNGSTAPRPAAPAIAPLPVVAREATASVNGAASRGSATAPADVSQRHLAPALKAAAAARARAARIRAEADRHALVAAVGDPSVVRGAPHPVVTSPVSIYHPPAAPPPPPSRGLSVAEATEAAQITFRPLRRGPDKPPYRTDYDRESSQTAPEDAAVAPSETSLPIEPPGKARLPDASARNDASAAETEGENRRRFGRTLAELDRYRAECREREPWSNVVPRPAAAVPSGAPAQPREAGSKTGADPEPWGNVVPRPAAALPAKPAAARKARSKTSGGQPEPWSSVVPRPAGRSTSEAETGTGESAWVRLWRRGKPTGPD
jgi:hypothetical protein